HDRRVHPRPPARRPLPNLGPVMVTHGHGSAEARVAISPNICTVPGDRFPPGERADYLFWGCGRRLAIPVEWAELIANVAGLKLDSISAHRSRHWQPRMLRS